MLTELEVSSSTFTAPTTRLKVRTDNVRPLAWMAFVFILSLFGLLFGTVSLKRFQGPSNPIINQFFLTEGPHHWILTDNQRCQGYIVGGWKKSKKIGEWAWFQFNILAPSGLAEQQGTIKAKFGDYRNLTSLSGKLNGSELSFDGTNWQGIDSPPNEIVLMVDALAERKEVKLPPRLSRKFDRFLGQYINEKITLNEVDKERFEDCVKELRQ